MHTPDPTANPSRALRAYAGLSRWLFGLALGGWLAFGLTAALLHGFIVPRIDDWRPWLEARASQALGAPLKIGRINAHSSGLLPSFELHDVALLGADGRTPLTVDRATVSVSALSLWRLGVEQIVLDAPQVRLERLADGGFALGDLRFGTDAGTPGGAAGSNPALDWLLAQPELRIDRGSVRLTRTAAQTDASAAATPALRLDDLRFSMHNQGRRHAARLDAQLDLQRGVVDGNGANDETRANASASERVARALTFVAELRAPLLSTQATRWRHWNGQVHADLPPTDLAALATLIGVAPAPDHGTGSLRVWADLKNSEWSNASADVRVADLSLRVPDAPAPLTLRRLDGRLDWQRLDAGRTTWQARELALVDGDGVRWPGSMLAFGQQRGGSTTAPPSNTFDADRIDIAQLAKLSRALPISADMRVALARLAPKGMLDAFHVGWTGPGAAFPPPRYRASGRASGIEFAAQPTAPRAGVRTNLGVPGMRGADASFDLNQDGGHATLRMAGGSATFPGIFEEPTVPFMQLDATVRWQRQGGGWEVSAQDLKFANADAAGSAQVRWRSDAPRAATASRSTASSGASAAATASLSASPASASPGAIELDGTLERGNVARLHRYLPLELPAPVRRYLRDALTAGSANAVRFQVKGALRDFPFVDTRRGQFRLTAQLRDATFVYAPSGSQPAGELPWPALTQMNGELVLDRVSLQVNRARGRLGSGPAALGIANASASIADFDRPIAVVDANTRAPLSELLKTLRSTPIDAMLDHALRNAGGSGSAELKVRLTLPIDQLERTGVQGSLVLADNDLRMDADGPQLHHVHGEVAFSERGFQIAGADAQLFGGPVRIDGGTSTTGRSDSGLSAALVELRARGSASAQGLRAAADAGLLTRAAHVLEGTTDYDARLRILRGGTELTVTSDLRGVAIALPAPLGKPADAALPLRYESTPVFDRAGATGAAAAQDQIALSLGEVGSVRYRRALNGDQAKVLSGSIALGPPASVAPPSPASGVAAKVDLARFSWDGWSDALDLLQQQDAQPGVRAKTGPVTTAAASAALRSYWPAQWQIRIGTLETEHIDLHRLSLDGTREGAVWRSTAQADELTGRLEFQEGTDGGPGRVLARLSRLKLSDPDQSPSIASPTPTRNDRPAGPLPALDVTVDRFELHGRDLGRLEIDATNQPATAGAARAWLLNKLRLTVPEAVFTAQGRWTQPPAVEHPAVGHQRAQERTALDFKLELTDSGRLLERFGMKDVVRQGRGEMLGWLLWNGAPTALDYPTLGGRFHLDVTAGQFMKADPGLAKLLGVLSLQTLPRRLSLDFRDLFSAGFAFDFVRGDVLVARGVASSNNLQMKGASAAVLMDGSADIASETQSLKVVVVPEIDAGTAALVATVINPALGLGTFLAQYFLRKPLSRAATQEFQIDGTWSDPRITKIPRPLSIDTAAQQGDPLAADTRR